MASTATYTCDGCRQPFTARVADRKRGWARFCSKACKASKQSKRFASGAMPKRWRRHDGVSPMKHKVCHVCGDPAVNGVYTAEGIEWGCALHHDTTLPLHDHGQW